MTPRLTIAIPTLNRAELLGRAIESALAQTSHEVEVIVSDNASTDKTPEILAPYAARGVRIFRQPNTIPASQNGTFLMREARGEFFVGLSDDDYLEPEFAAKVLALYDRHPELSFVYTGCAVHYEEIQVPALVGPEVEPGLDFLLGHYEDKRELSWCACVTRLRHLRALGPQPDDRIVGDMFFWTKMAFLGPVGCVPEVLSHYILLRAQNDNISHGTSPVVWTREAHLLADEVMDGARKAGASAEYLTRLDKACRQHVARSAANQFVWTRIRGASAAKALQWSFECLPFIGLDLRALSRLGAGLLMPRGVLRQLLLRGAEKQRTTRRSL
ncbi:MAG: glycosyltransferase family 2 protein [Acidobacteria bacterium]|nr:glycosyltransferase family 2 protein [Acidobacteriota bacterium]